MTAHVTHAECNEKCSVQLSTAQMKLNSQCCFMNICWALKLRRKKCRAHLALGDNCMASFFLFLIPMVNHCG